MKIREGFVSNSSSSSFILNLNDDDHRELRKEILREQRIKKLKQIEESIKNEDKERICK